MEKRLFGFARLPAPSICPDCGGKLGPIQNGVTYDKKYRETSPPQVRLQRLGVWRFCDCGCFVTWSCVTLGDTFRGSHGWKRRHVMPLFDDGKVVLLVDDRG